MIVTPSWSCPVGILEYAMKCLMHAADPLMLCIPRTTASAMTETVYGSSPNVSNVRGHSGFTATSRIGL